MFSKQFVSSKIQTDWWCQDHQWGLGGMACIPSTKKGSVGPPPEDF